jgi:hypothetical protein
MIIMNVPYFAGQVKQKCLVLWGEDDGIISNKEAYVSLPDNSKML